MYNEDNRADLNVSLFSVHSPVLLFLLSSLHFLSLGVILRPFGVVKSKVQSLNMFFIK